MTEAEILAAYSTPGLRRCELTPWAKKMQLRDFVPEWRAKEILAELYPEQAATTAQPAKAQAQVLEIIKTNGDIARKVLNDWIDKRIVEIERVTGIPRELLRPHLYRD